ncbi:hypothetical protein KAFR_0A03750 [Kazachstania africana CBS 2517]|uniref:Proteasome assembly chaperone 4 n=1 Tax=Kazachstania africana (strain ATCC 22294 / BCRC 22015 / CBS 2517 / CECT 1963 / NBRC 1671 / NRRL Y-8276) TaxID=1071382 RepID=H2AN60_KAZAF|nr:hypothetical protein KAFR_0A03750 [Kazachstania africana CBS 2517]CCF55810.1 hypothetical protein KAFR_0A03750 [Kazachstania africana CBS 2517]
MSVKTVFKTITSESSLNQSIPIEIIATIPEDLQASKIPISLTLCYQKDRNNDSKYQIPSTFMYYHYSIPNRLRTKKATDDDVIGIPLIDTDNDWIKDISRKIANMVAKKYNKPCYVAWSNTKLMDNSTISMDQLFVLRSCMEFVQSIMKQ